ncbi:hypothetical protein O9993_19520 [Vibrio lentus]|nr:hypothetical protein [Vibrio lentus]
MVSSTSEHIASAWHVPRYRSEVLDSVIYQLRLLLQPDIAQEYKKIEAAAEQKTPFNATGRIPRRFRALLNIRNSNKEEQSIVKQADTICAYLKCLEELSAGNHEYEQAKTQA